jgi:hypothetical protein
LDIQNVAGLVNQTALTTVAPSVNNLSAWLFIVGDGVTLSSMSVEVTTFGASEVGRVGIYTNTNDNIDYPANLVVESGELDLGSNGLKTVSGLATNLPPGLYWMTFICGVLAGTLRGITAGGHAPILGLDNSLTVIGKLFGSRTYGALPSTFPAGFSTANIGNPAVGMVFST